MPALLAEKSVFRKVLPEAVADEEFRIEVGFAYQVMRSFAPDRESSNASEISVEQGIQLRMTNERSESVNLFFLLGYIKSNRLP